MTDATMPTPAPTGGSAGKLLPCPFCGGEADLSKGQKGDGSPWHYVECFKCASMAEPDVWNTRQPPQPTGDVGELVERLRRLAKEPQEIPTADAMEHAADMLESFNSRSTRITNERGETLMDPDTNTPLTWEQRWRQTEACFIDAKRRRMAAEQAHPHRRVQVTVARVAS